MGSGLEGSCYRDCRQLEQRSNARGAWVVFPHQAISIIGGSAHNQHIIGALESVGILRLAVHESIAQECQGAGNFNSLPAAY